MADISGDLIFNRFGPIPGVPDTHDEHGLDLLSNSARDIAPAQARDLNLGQIASAKDGWMDLAPEAAHSSAVEPNIDSTPKEACVIGPPDSCPAVGSNPRTPKSVESGWAPVMEFTNADIF